MLGSLDEVGQFFRLHRALMFFVNRRLGVIAGEVASPDDYSCLPGDDRIEVHRALLGHLDLIGDFVAENPSGFDEEELEVVRSWSHLEAGTFVVFRHLKAHTIFLGTGGPPVAFGVHALAEPFDEVIGPDLPVMVETTLLPFRGRIVYDGLMVGYNVSFGSGYRRSFKESYDEAKERFGIVTRLPFDPGGVPEAATKAEPGKRAMKPGKSGGASSTTEKVRRAHDEIVALTDAFCRAHLDDEYAELCRRMAGVLARKRPSPLAGGKPESWACGIARTVGWVNFLGDPSQPHHMKMTDVDAAFGVSEATGSAKSKVIRDRLKLRRLSPEWTLPSRMDDNPLIWMLRVNGLIVDVRDCPREAQEVAFEQGLIPYVPADRPSRPADE